MVSFVQDDDLALFGQLLLSLSEIWLFHIYVFLWALSYLGLVILLHIDCRVAVLLAGIGAGSLLILSFALFDQASTNLR